MRASGNFGDVYEYETMPKALRVQMYMIFSDILGPQRSKTTKEPGEPWVIVRDVVRKEHGLHYLYKSVDPAQDVLSCLNEGTNIRVLLDIVETGLSVAESKFGKLDEHQLKGRLVNQSPADAARETNIRMREAAFGYQYVSGKLIRVDNQFTHAEIVKPALLLLSDPRFLGAEQEYLDAHTHYRKSEFKPAIVHANNAFESTLKTICHLRSWPVTEGAVASHLLKIVRNNGLMPDYLEKSFDQFYTTLENGLPKVRHNAGGHGDGPTPKEVPRHIAAYALHLAATNIVLLVDAFNALPPLPKSA